MFNDSSYNMYTLLARAFFIPLLFTSIFFLGLSYYLSYPPSDMNVAKCQSLNGVYSSRYNVCYKDGQEVKQ